MRRWAVAVGAAALAVAADTAAWRIGVQQLDSGLDRYIAAAQAHDWSVSAGKRTQGGWPFAATLTVSDLHVEGGLRLMPGGLEWGSARTILRVAWRKPGRLDIEAVGAQRLRLSHAPRVVFAANELSADIDLGRHSSGGRLRAEGLSGGIAGSGHPADVRIASLLLGLADSTAQSQTGEPAVPWQSARLEIAAHGVGLPDIGRWPLGGFVSDIGGTLSLTALPPRRTEFGTTPEDQARSWRDGGGRLEVRDMRLHWGPLRVTAQASLGLDDRLQPAGTGQADVAGSAPALDALADARVIAPGLAATAKAVLGVMPPAPQSNGVRLPFVVHDNTLSVARIPVVRLHDIAWHRRGPT